MPRLFRPEWTDRADGRRWAIGVSVSSRCTEATAALVGVLGRGYEMLAEAAEVVSAPIPKEASTFFAAASAGGPQNSSTTVTTPAAVGACRSQLAEVEAMLVNQLAAKRGIFGQRILAVGIHDPGLWSVQRGETRSYVSLSEAARVAELTGMNVIDAFPARDLAGGGQGGPATAAAEWILLRSHSKVRALVDLGRTTRLTYLPAASTPRAESQILSFEVGPGSSLLDLLCRKLTNNQHAFDPGGHFAVQGRKIPELLAVWSRDPYFETPPPRWHPYGVRPERFLTAALQRGTTEGWSVRDILCTATHFVAEAIAEAIRRRLTEQKPIEEIIVCGGGQRNGMLIREIAEINQLPLIRLSDLRFPENSFEAASVGMLALLYVDQEPAAQPSISKVAAPRMLGQLTPGSAENWRRLLRECAGMNDGPSRIKKAS